MFKKGFWKKVVDAVITVGVCVVIAAVLLGSLPGTYEWTEIHAQELYTGAFIDIIVLITYVFVESLAIVVSVLSSLALIGFAIGVCFTGKGVLWLAVDQKYVLRFSLLQQRIKTSL